MKGFNLIARVSVAILAASVPVCVSAADANENKPWTVSAELGAISTSGNTQTTSFNGKIEIAHKMERFHNDYVVSALYKKDKITQDNGARISETTADKYYLSAKSAYPLENEFSKLFVFGSHAHDEFGAYREYSTFSAGYGMRLLNEDVMQLDVEIGPGYFRGKKVLDDNTTVTESGAMVRAAGVFAWQLTESAEFKQALEVQASSDNTRTISDTSISAKISDRMQMKVGYTFYNDSDVAPGKKGTDTTTYINLVYNF